MGMKARLEYKSVESKLEATVARRQVAKIQLTAQSVPE